MVLAARPDKKQPFKFANLPVTIEPEFTMPDLKILSRLLMLCFVTLSIAACSKSSDERSTLLQFVPAESPFVFASLEPLPEDVSDKLEPTVDSTLRAYAAVIVAAIDSNLEEAKKEGRTDADLETAKSIGAEIASLMSIDGLRGAGIGRDSTFVLYGNGLLPVLRMRLTDGGLMEKIIARIEQKAGDKLSVGTIDGQSYRYAGDEVLQIVIALIDDDLVIGAVPSGYSDDLLKSVLGLHKPNNSMADSGELTTIAAENGFSSQSLLLLDITRMASAFVDDQSGSNQELLALFDYSDSGLSDVCKAEIREMAGVVPRMIAGYTEITTDEMNSNFIIEVREDIAKGLATLVAPVQGLGTTEGGLFSFGMSLDMLAARSFYSARLDALEANPYECEYFSELQAGVEMGREAWNQPLPPIVYSVKGFLALVDAIEGLDIATKQPPTSIDASFLLSLDNPEGLLAMGTMFSPELAALDLQADGKPVKIDLPPVSPALSNAYVAMTDNALAISLGSDASEKLGDLLQAGFADPAPFMNMDMDAGKYYGFIGEMMNAVPADSKGALPEVNAATSDLMVAMAGWFDRMSFTVNFTERGVEMLSTIELAETD